MVLKLHVGVLGSCQSASKTTEHNGHCKEWIDRMAEKNGAKVEVELFDVSNQTPKFPTHSDLEMFDVLIVYTHYDDYWNTGISDLLCDCVEKNATSIMCMSACGRTDYGFGGRFIEDYSAYKRGDGNGNTFMNFGTIALPDHPVLNGIDSINHGPLYAYRPVVHPEGTEICRLDDETLLCAERKLSNNTMTFMCNLYPIAEAYDSSLGYGTLNCEELMWNCLVYCATAADRLITSKFNVGDETARSVITDFAFSQTTGTTDGPLSSSSSGSTVEIPSRARSDSGSSDTSSSASLGGGGLFDSDSDDSW